MKRIGFILATLFVTFTAYAQSPSLTLSKTDSNCKANGTITVTGHTGGTGTIKYAITQPTNRATPPLEEGVFTGLEPGSYTIGLFDNTSSGTPIATKSITVGGSYTEMRLTVTASQNTSTTGRYCVDKGTLTVSFTGGTAPYTIRIVNGADVREHTIATGAPATTKSYTFTAVPDGSYSATVIDACGEEVGTISNVAVISSYPPIMKDEQITSATISAYTFKSSTCDNLTVSFSTGNMRIYTTTKTTGFLAYSYPYLFSFRIKYTNKEGEVAYSGIATSYYSYATTMSFSLANFDRTLTDKIQVEVRSSCNSDIWVPVAEQAVPAYEAITAVNVTGGYTFTGSPSSCSTVTVGFKGTTVTTPSATYYPTNYPYPLYCRLKYTNNMGVEKYTSPVSLTGIDATNTVNVNITDFDILQTTKVQLEVSSDYACNGASATWVAAAEQTIPESEISFIASSYYLDYTGFCESPTARVQLYQASAAVGSFSYGCYPYYVEASAAGETTKFYNWTSSSSIYLTGLKPGTDYTIKIWQGTSADGVLLGTCTVKTQSLITSASNPNGAQYISSFSTYANYSQSGKCDFDTFYISSNYSYSNAYSVVIAGQSITYTIVSGPEGVTREPITLPDAVGTLWTDLPAGSYVIGVNYDGCNRYEEKTLTITKAHYGFEANSTAIQTVTCNDYTIRATGYFLNSESERMANYSAYYYVHLINADTNAHIAYGSSSVYTGFSYDFDSRPPGNYVIEYRSSNNRTTSCLYGADTLTILPKEGPTVDIPQSGGISCPEGDGRGTLTITVKEGTGTEPFYYRYKHKDDLDFSEFGTTNEFPNLEIGEYVVQVRDNCNTVTQQELTLFNGTEQFTRIEGAVSGGQDGWIICSNVDAILTVRSIGPVKTFQWQKLDEDTNTWHDLPEASGGNSIEYVIKDATTDDIGLYRVLIYNGFCNLESEIAIIQILLPTGKPEILGDGYEEICSTGNGTVLVANTSETAPHTYEWYLDGDLIPGATENTYHTVQGGSYVVVVKPEGKCPSVPSEPHLVVRTEDACVEASDDTFEMDACDVAGGYIDVLANDRTAGCPAVITVITGPSHGSAVVETIEGVSQIKYTPNDTFIGVDELTYKIACASNESSTVTVSIHVKSSIMVEVHDADNASEPDKSGKFTIRFTCSGVRYSKALNIKYTVEPTVAVSGVDFVPLTGTIQMPANTPSVSLEVEPINNYVVEGNDRTVKVTITEVTELP